MYRHRNTFVLNIEFLQTKFYDITWFLAFPNHQVHQLDPNIKITKTKINNQEMLFDKLINNIIFPCGNTVVEKKPPI